MSALDLIKALILPPVSLLLLVLFGLLLSLRWRRTGWVLSMGAALAMLVLAMPITGALLMAGLAADLPRTPPPTNLPAAVVILSAEARPLDAARTVFEPGPLTWERLIAGGRIARISRLPILVSGGPIDGGPIDSGPINGGSINGGRGGEDAPTLAGTMATALTQLLNLTPRWQETRSRDTWENARYSAEILRSNGIASVYLVSHGWHLRRAILAFRHFGITATAVPVRPTPWPSVRTQDFIPSLGGWTASFYGMHEWIGEIYYAMRG